MDWGEKEWRWVGERVGGGLRLQVTKVTPASRPPYKRSTNRCSPPPTWTILSPLTVWSFHPLSTFTHIYTYTRRSQCIPTRINLDTPPHHSRWISPSSSGAYPFLASSHLYFLENFLVHILFFIVLLCPRCSSSGFFYKLSLKVER